MKRGISLVELVVAMGIFSIIATLVVGAFVVILNMKGLVSTMRESQQKLRVAIETTSRLSRQAEAVGISPNKRELTLFQNVGQPTMTKFIITADGLYEQNCLTVNADDQACTSWDANQIDLLGGTMKLDITTGTGSQFRKNGAKPTTLEVNLVGKIEGAKSYYNDQFQINNVVVLESLK
jgi:prepilin-type N-terminal cleavage/methylation domain-containing protein